MSQETTDESPLLLATLPPSQGQVRAALGVVATLIILFAVTLPLRDIQLPRVDVFVPVLQTSITITDLITAALLYAQFYISRQWSLLILASGYLFSALIVVPYALTFPGAYAPTGLLGAGLQTTTWIYASWHIGLPLAVIVYVLLKDADSKIGTVQHPSSIAVGWSVGAVTALVCGVALLTTVGEQYLPKIMSDGVKVNVSLGVSLIYGGWLMSLIVIALALLWRRRGSVLDLWLMVMCFAWLVEITLGTVLATARFTFGWYGSRIYAFIAAITLLIALLSEMTTLYSHLARSLMRQRAARQQRHLAMDAMAASIAHEVSQPLAAITANSEAALMLLPKVPENDQVRAALEDVVSSSARAGEIIGTLRAMFKQDTQGREQTDVNGVIHEALAILELDLRTQDVSVSTELQDGVPQPIVDRAQLRQVFLNLILNAIDAMRSVDRARELRIMAGITQDCSNVIITIEDSGSGLVKTDPKRIFEPFFTTKPTGMGIGLTVCRSIIESHRGTLQASARHPHGTIFEVALPIGTGG